MTLEHANDAEDIGDADEEREEARQAFRLAQISFLTAPNKANAELYHSAAVDAHLFGVIEKAMLDEVETVCRLMLDGGVEPSYEPAEVFMELNQIGKFRATGTHNFCEKVLDKWLATIRQHLTV